MTEPLVQAWEPIRISVPGAPFGKQRARARQRGTFTQMYTPQDTVNYEAKVAMAGQQAMAGRDPLDEPLAVGVFAVTAIPPSWSKRKQALAITGEVRPIGKPDLDNLIKALFDGLNKIVWRDDSIIVECMAQKWYGTKPGVELEVRSASEWFVYKPVDMTTRDE